MSIKHFILISQGWDGGPIAYHAQDEGFDVVFGQVQDKKELKNGDDTEDPEIKKQRLSQYDGMMKKVPAEQLVEALIKVKNKDEYLIFCDQNNLWHYGEVLAKAGFKNGLFPTKQDYTFEKDRELAMAFVKKNYPDVKIIPFEEMKTVDEAIKFLESSEGIYVIQSKGDFVSTYVPQNDDPEMAKEQSISQLEKYRKDYEKGGLILKTKLIDPVEITPQIVFWNGKPVFTDLDLETKNIGDGENNGNQVGCGSNLIIKTDFEDKINKIAFPKAVYDMAKTHTGIFVWDISLYVMPDGIYFGEFCPNRFGYDAVMTEMTMAGGVRPYFESIMNGKNPLKDTFGTAIRLFNLERKEDQQISYDKSIADQVWLFEVKKKDEEMVSVGDCWDLGVLTASADSIDEAVKILYNSKEKFSFKEVYARTDLLHDYPTSIIHRFKAINHTFIEAPDLKTFDAKSRVEALTKVVESMHSDIKAEYESKLTDGTRKLKEKDAELQSVKKNHTKELGDIKQYLKKTIYEN